MQLRENYHPATTHEEILYALYLQQIRTNELLEKLVPKEPEAQKTQEAADEATMMPTPTKPTSKKPRATNK